jgi:SAM-dependent methyltransferase
MSQASAGHWSEISNKWALVGQPLRPSAEDIAAFQSVIDLEMPSRGLILGVTPELYVLNWPDGCDLLAMDNNSRMIDTVWPGGRDQVVLGDWRWMPLADESKDVAFCDGGFHLLSHPEGQIRLIRSVRRALAPSGVCAIRLFAPVAGQESETKVLANMIGGEVPNLNILKLRLGMAMQKSPRDGVRLGDVWERIAGLADSFQSLAERVGWPLDHLRAIDTYRGSDSRYCFVSPSEVEDLFCSQVGGFRLEGTIFPSYELGERCPVVIFRKI